MIYRALSFLLLAVLVCGVAAFNVANTGRARSPRRVLEMARVPFVAGNWKMNPQTMKDAVELAKQTLDLTKGQAGKVEISLFPPHPFLVPVQAVIENTHISLGSQNVYFEDKGAYTGAVSIDMLKSVGSKYVLCGHSERRTLFRDDDQAVSRKVRKVLDDGLSAIVCIGETRDEYEAGLNQQVCAVQLAKDLYSVKPEEMDKVVIAYEPVWAIGTGLTATPDIAQGVHFFIRELLAKKFGRDVADATRIQYGGSVNAENVDELMACPDIDGALVGGASLVPEKFARIVNFQTKSPVSV